MSSSTSFPLSFEEVAEACDGEIRGSLQAAGIRGLNTDTRMLAAGQIFVALQGETHDGHDFLEAAREAGAAAAIVSDAQALPEGFPAIVVADTQRALGRVAAACRQRMPAAVAAITGSTGKTTTKDMLGELMSAVGSTVVAEGTQNNEVGVPLTLLRLTPEDRYCILELAMRAPGEIAYLAEIARPEIGVITNIGQSHVGRLGSREAIAQAKAELLEYLPPDGAAVLNADDFFFSVFEAMAPCEVLSFGLSPGADFHAREIDDRGLDGVSFELVTPADRSRVNMQVPGRHSVLNALACAAAAHRLGVEISQIAHGLERCRGSAMRMQQVRGRAGSVIINDAYNASPDSVAAALEVLRSVPAERRILVFGDMLEMGPEAARAHREVGDAVAAAGLDRLIAVGRLAAIAAARAEELGVAVQSVSGAEMAADLLADELAPGDVVLVKGSRGMRLEQAVEALSDDD